MERQALGLIETVGLIGGIEAADAAAKAAAITLVKSEVTTAALVTIHIEGELGAVQAAVEAGVKAAQKVGQVLSSVVIPRPDEGLGTILDEPSNLYQAPAPFCAIVEPPKSKPKQTTTTSVHIDRDADTSESEYASMTVAALRRLARRRNDLPISGREIALADKQLLIRLLSEADREHGGEG